MQSSCVLRLQAGEDEELSAGSRTVYRRYLIKFNCVIPRVHGGYFKSPSRVIQRVHQKGLQQFLFGRLTDREVGLMAKAFISQKSRRWNWSFQKSPTASRMIAVGLRPLSKMDCFSVGGRSEDCIGLPRTTSVHVWKWNVLLVGGHSEDCIGSPRITSGCYFLWEQRHDEAWFRSIGRCSSWNRIGKSSSNKDGHSKSSWRRKEGGRPLRRLHWLASDGPCLMCRASPDGRVVWRRLRVEIRGWSVEETGTVKSVGLCLSSNTKADTLTRDPYYRHFWQDTSTGRRGRQICGLFRKPSRTGSVRKRKHEEESTLGCHRTGGQLHKSGNLQEENMSLSHHQSLAQPDSWRLGTEFTDYF